MLVGKLCVLYGNLVHGVRVMVRFCRAYKYEQQNLRPIDFVSLERRSLEYFRSSLIDACSLFYGFGWSSCYDKFVYVFRISATLMVDQICSYNDEVVIKG